MAKRARTAPRTTAEALAQLRQQLDDLQGARLAQATACGAAQTAALKAARAPCAAAVRAAQAPCAAAKARVTRGRARARSLKWTADQLRTPAQVEKSDRDRKGAILGRDRSAQFWHDGVGAADAADDAFRAWIVRTRPKQLTKIRLEQAARGGRPEAHTILDEMVEEDERDGGELRRAFEAFQEKKRNGNTAALSAELRHATQEIGRLERQLAALSPDPPAPQLPPWDGDIPFLLQRNFTQARPYAAMSASTAARTAARSDGCSTSHQAIPRGPQAQPSPNCAPRSATPSPSSAAHRDGSTGGNSSRCRSSRLPSRNTTRSSRTEGRT